MERLVGIINNPVRAEMIAQTESVNSWSLGQVSYVRETGARTKVWEALAGACTLCAPFGGIKMELDDEFPGGVLRPARHPLCRCSVCFEY